MLRLKPATSPPRRPEYMNPPISPESSALQSLASLAVSLPGGSPALCSGAAPPGSPRCSRWAGRRQGSLPESAAGVDLSGTVLLGSVHLLTILGPPAQEQGKYFHASVHVFLYLKKLP